MKLEKLRIGQNPPDDVYVFIEISMNAEPIKYELDKETGLMFVDRIISTNMRYPCNYGFIPHTLSGDGDPIDVLVISSLPIMASAVINVRPIGVLVTEDEKGQDEKILAVPIAKVDPVFEKITSYEELPDVITQQIEHFFKHYKDLEKGKWVNVKSWEGQSTAKKLILDAISRFQSDVS